MPADEEKKKKKKVKKAAAAAEEAPPPAPEPEPTPEPAPAPPAEEAPPAEAAPAEGGEGEAPVEGELPPQPKQKPKFFVHWDRRKPKFYDYNFDYGANYYSSMVGYVDAKNAAFSSSGSGASVPRRMAFAERGMYSSLARSRNPDVRTQSLLNDVRSSIRNFETSQRVYAYGSNRRK